jgi:8-hydroxy-5-deazaflavin:NADPH oxidoreductase
VGAIGVEEGETTMKIGIIGSGDVAKALGKGFIGMGHQVMLGSRDPAKLKEWATTSGGITGDFSETAQFAEVAVLAVKGTAAVAVLRLAGVENLKNKPLIDACNPIADAPPEDGVLQFFTGPNESLMEKLQHIAPDAHLVKAFSCIGSALMVNPDFKDGKPTMFICGNSTDAKNKVTTLCENLGFEVADMGGAAAARAIEPLCMLWCIPGFRENNWRHAFKLIR